MSFQILGLGTAVPETASTQQESLACAQAVCRATPEQARWLSSVYAHSGINTRHLSMPRAVVEDVLAGTRHSDSIWLPSGEPDDAGPSTAERMHAFQESAGPLALQAARRAVAESGIGAEEITHLVLVTCTGFNAPGIDRLLVQELRLSPLVERTQVGFMGCHGALNGLRVASAFSLADPAANVLLCAVELCSLHYHYGWDTQRLIANALFADGAAAVVGSARSQQGAQAWRLRATGSCLIPDSADAMTWTIGNHGFQMTLDVRIPRLIAQNLRTWLSSWLARHGLAIEQVESWAVHPGGPRILGAIEESLGLSSAQTADSRAILADYGNMSSATVLFILDRLRNCQAPRPCVALGFGPGLWAEATLFD